jgi:hypothetical protein
MKSLFASFLCLLGFTALPLLADTASSALPLVGPNDTGTVTYSEWVDGAEKPIVHTDANGAAQPLKYFWSPEVILDYRSLLYGDSKTPGLRRLRIAFEKPVTVGSVLVRGVGQVSVLKPDATLPGDLTDDSQWIPAQRLENGKVSDSEPNINDAVIWTLPKATTTQAIRITHTAQPTDKIYAGTLAGFAVLTDRWANISPQGLAFASAADQHAFRLNDESVQDGNGVWENISPRDGDRPKTIAQDPEWVMLVWPKTVTLGGLALLTNYYGEAQVQSYNGPDGKHPRDAAETDWQTVQTVSGVKPQYPSPLDLQSVSFASPVTTRALRIRFTADYDETNINFRIAGNARGGKRVALGEFMALQPLDTASLETAILPVDKSLEAHAPIPIKFTTPDDGEVTLVIEDASGKRIRNLVSQTPFPKGENTVWWDGTDDLTRDPAASDHGIYYIPPEIVSPGTYTVRGIWHKPLDLRYEFTVYSPGDPPWPTADTSGGWMTNHTPASCAVLIPADRTPTGQPLVAIGAAVSEGGSALSWVDLNGKKVGGRGWIGGVWTGASYLAADYGPEADPNTAVYVGSTFEGNKKYGIDGKIEIRLTKLSKNLQSGDKPVVTDKILIDSPPAPPPGSENKKAVVRASDYLGGMAVRNGLLVFSEPVLNKLVFVNATAGAIIGDTGVSDPRGVAFDNDGRLLVLTTQSLLRYPAGVSVSNFPDNPERLVTNLEDPRGITVDSSGKIYVSDQGTSHQVKMYSPEGKPLAVFGKPGIPKAGIYDPLHMNNPKGLTVDTNGRLWVTEDDFLPKRVSVWNADGTLWKAYYGPSRYGGGGIMDSKAKGAFLYDGMEFKLDWDKGDYQLTRVYYRPTDSDLQLAFRDGPPEAPVYFNGKRYITDTYNSNPISGQVTNFIFLDKGDGGAVVPVAAAGVANDWPVLKTDAFKSLWPKGLDPQGDRGKNAAFFIWSDLNGDGQVQPDEVKIIAGSSGGVTVGDDGSFLISRLGPDATHLQATRFKPVRFTDLGAPVYDIASPEALAPAQPPGGDGGDQLLTGTDGWLVMTTPPPPFSKLGLGGAKDGKPAWSYPSLWPGLHPSHNAPAADQPGELTGTTRLLGGLVTPKGSESGPLFFINCNMGDLYAFTQDGLFVAQLFQDIRVGPLWEMPTAVRNMLVNGLSLHDENFFPSVAQTSEGQVYLNSGGMNIVRVDNLDTIRNIAPNQIQVTADELKQAQDYVVAREAARQAAQGSGVLAVPILATAPTVDGNLDAWNDAQWAAIDHRGVGAWFNSPTKPYDVNGAIAVSGDKLFATWKTADPRLLVNAGDVPNALFKSGGALDLMIGADPTAKPDRPAAVPGDERLLVSQVAGKTRALLYRPVVPGTADKDKVPFNAPWHGITLDRVDDVSDQVTLAADKNGDYEISVPLAVLGLKPQAGMRIKGDIGILRGDGKQTNQRIYWANKATAIVSDVPTEAELTPKLWGLWEFDQK